MTTTTEREVFELPISTDYVSHWGWWEAVRELLQNGLDQRDADPENCVFEWKATSDQSILEIKTSTGSLARSSLVLGNSTKAESEGQRGKFGEGYKLALLVLCRLGYHVEIITRDEIWVPKIEYSDKFECEVLKIEVAKYAGEDEPGVTFIIYGTRADDIHLMAENMCDHYGILIQPEQKGRVYVGGLYVMTNDKFKYGYSFKAGEISLDRDRSAVYDFDLGWRTSMLWNQAGVDQDKLAELVRQDAPDVSMLTHHETVRSGTSTVVWSSFTREHGQDAIPVSTQDEVEAATKAGVKWVLVNDTMKRLIMRAVSIVIPGVEHETGLEDLVAWRDKHKSSLGLLALRDLDRIIKRLKNEVKS